MADQTTQQGQATEQVKVEEQVKGNELIQEIKPEPWKAEIAGLNKKISDYQAQLKVAQDQIEAERISKMSAEEQLQAKIKKAQDDLESTQAQSRAIKIENALLVNGLSKDFAGMINGSTDDEITASIRILKERITTEATAMAEAERNKLFGNGGKDIKSTTNDATKIEFTREELQTKEGRDLYRKNQPLGAKIIN